MNPILYQGSGGTFGDLLLSSHGMYQLSKNRKVSAAVPADLRVELKEFYDKHTFLDMIIVLDRDVFSDGAKFSDYATRNQFEPYLYLKDLRFAKDLTFHLLREWFEYEEKPSMNFEGCIGVQVASSTNWARPSVPYLREYFSLMRKAWLKPVFIGTKKDEENLLNRYPSIRSWFDYEEQYWRFGKDSALQTLSNVSSMTGMLVFSSWTAYAAVLQGVPTLELWSEEQWQFYSPVVGRMLGSPIHYLQDSCRSIPNPHLFTDVFPNLKRLCKDIYGI